MRAHATAVAVPRKRLRLDVTGAVQGVGFRPFIHRQAERHGLAGFVCNTDAGATLEIEGPDAAVNAFLAVMERELAPPAAIAQRHIAAVPLQDAVGFRILPSAEGGAPSARILSDLATCPECLREIFDPTDRRHLYPFTTCMHCGPRYSILEAVPYDRVRTAMRHFSMCPACRAEYEDPCARRFHAETIACPDCGPKIALWGKAGNALASRGDALRAAADALRDGRIVALKGLGGFQLLVDARNDAAVQRLRDRKRRPAKPFAVMAPSLGDAHALAQISKEEEALLTAPEAPIVLLRARGTTLAPNVAPGNPLLGLMLPYSPLHHILMRALGFPVVATSGNYSGGVIVTEEHAALSVLGEIADLFLVHDRPVLRPVDDSVVRMIAGRPTVLRLARGYAPHERPISEAGRAVLAVGGHQKDAVAVATGTRLVLGPHIGDLGGSETRAAFAETLDGMAALCGATEAGLVRDAHPDYFTTRFATARDPDAQPVQHHLAHVLSGMADNDLEAPVLGVAWDGTGYGADGTVWGGEFLLVESDWWRRVAHLKPFRLPGGEAAVHEPRRAALGVLLAALGDAVLARTDLAPVAAFSEAERRLLGDVLAKGINAPWTSSAGRLFDAVSALLDLHQKASFEGEAAMAVEFSAAAAPRAAILPPFALMEAGDVLILDWRPTVIAMVEALKEGVDRCALAAAFHNALGQSIAAVAGRIGAAKVLLTGGCFQNARLTEDAVEALRAAGHTPYWHHRIPPNDGGLAVGQCVHALNPRVEERV